MALSPDNLSQLETKQQNEQIKSLERVQKIISGLENNSLKELLIDFKCTKEEQESIIAALKKNVSIEQLHFSGNGSAWKTVDILKVLKGKAIISLKLEAMDINDQELKTLSELLKFLPNLIKLSLKQNKITDAGFKEFWVILPRLFCLRSLDLSDNPISDETAKKIAALLMHPRYLKNLAALHLNNTKFSWQGLIGVAKALKANRSLVTLEVVGETHLSVPIPHHEKEKILKELENNTKIINLKLGMFMKPINLCANFILSAHIPQTVVINKFIVDLKNNLLMMIKEMEKGNTLYFPKGYKGTHGGHYSPLPSFEYDPEIEQGKRNPQDVFLGIQKSALTFSTKFKYFSSSEARELIQMGAIACFSNPYMENEDGSFLTTQQRLDYFTQLSTSDCSFDCKIKIHQHLTHFNFMAALSELQNGDKNLSKKFAMHAFAWGLQAGTPLSLNEAKKSLRIILDLDPKFDSKPSNKLAEHVTELKLTDYFKQLDDKTWKDFLQSYEQTCKELHLKPRKFTKLAAYRYQQHHMPGDSKSNAEQFEMRLPDKIDGPALTQEPIGLTLQYDAKNNKSTNESENDRQKETEKLKM